MKKLLLATFVFITVFAKAQIFAPQGAEWKYFTDLHILAGGGLTTFKYTGDTIINSQPCKKIEIPGHWGNTIEQFWEGIFCMYSDENAIYYYNPRFNLFNKIFDYTLNIGDSLLIYEMYSCELMYDQDSYYTHIINKGADTINGIPYRWLEYQYNSPYGTSADEYYFNGKYYEKLGFLNGFLTVQPDHCIPDGWFIECLSSYRDNTVHFTSPPLYYADDCLPYWATTVTENPTVNFSLYPNPVVDGVINIKSELGIENITLINTLGQTVLSAKPVNNSLETGYLPQGMYIAKLTFANGKQAYKPLVY